MLTGENLVRIKLNKNDDNDGISMFLDSLYDICGDDEIEIFHKGKYVKGYFTKHNNKEDIYRINTGNSFVELSGNSLIQTPKGDKKVNNLKTSDLIACYEADNNFSENNIAYRSIYSINPVKGKGSSLYSCNVDFTLENEVVIKGE